MDRELRFRIVVYKAFHEVRQIDTCKFGPLTVYIGGRRTQSDHVLLMLHHIPSLHFRVFNHASNRIPNGVLLV
jgi:hypothetical protein